MPRLNGRAYQVHLTTMLFALVVFSSGCNGFFLSNNDLDSLSVSPENVFITQGSTVQLFATGTTIGGDTTDESTYASWTSSNTSAATIDKSGLVSGLSGQGTISATTIKVIAHDKSDSTTVAVTESPLTAVLVSPSDANLAPGYTRQLLATGLLADNNTVTVTSYVRWTSSDTSVATVSSAGKVTAVKSGTCTITAKAQLSNSALTSTTTITVTS